MKTLADVQCRKEIAERVGRVRTDSQRQWGKMSAHQMVCHLADSFRGVMGERSLALTPTFGHGVIKWIALYAPLQWPHGLKTMPGGRSGDRRNQARGICSRQARLAATIRKVYAPAERFRMEASSDVYGDVGEGLDALGVPAHGSSLKTVWRVKGKRSNDVTKERSKEKSRPACVEAVSLPHYFVTSLLRFFPPQSVAEHSRQSIGLPRRRA
jgi:hypothetical protein